MSLYWKSWIYCKKLMLLKPCERVSLYPQFTLKDLTWLLQKLRGKMRGKAFSCIWVPVHILKGQCWEAGGSACNSCITKSNCILYLNLDATLPGLKQTHVPDWCCLKQQSWGVCGQYLTPPDNTDAPVGFWLQFSCSSHWSVPGYQEKQQQAVVELILL